MIIPRAANKVQKNALKWVRDHKIPDLSMAIVSKTDIPFASNDCLVFGVVREAIAKTTQEFTLYYDIEYEDEPIWSCANREEYLDAIAEWDYDVSVLPHIQRAIVAATGLTDKELCKALKINQKTLDGWLKFDNVVEIPPAKVKKIWELIVPLVRAS